MLESGNNYVRTQVVDMVEQIGLLNRIKAAITHISPYQGIVLLFNKAIVILVPGPTTRKLKGVGHAIPKSHDMVIEKLAAIIRVDFFYLDWQTSQNSLKTILNG